MMSSIPDKKDLLGSLDERVPCHVLERSSAFENKYVEKSGNNAENPVKMDYLMEHNSKMEKNPAILV